MDKIKFRLTYIDEAVNWNYERFLEQTSADPRLIVTRIDSSSPADSIILELSRNHGYYISSGDRALSAYRVTAGLLKKMPMLLNVVTYGSGCNTVDVDACTSAGVAVTNQAGGNVEAVAEHTIGVILSLLKRIPETQAALHAGIDEPFIGRELLGRTVGIVGLGHIGTRTAEILKAFRCRVIASDPYIDAEVCSSRGAEKVSFEELLSQSEIVAVHCPLTSETRGLFGDAEFAMMQPGSLFVTTARGGIHDERALHEALERGHIAGAGLDVWEQEPPPRDHPLLSHPRVLPTAHSAGATGESRTRLALMAASAFSAVADGQAPPRLVNPTVLADYMRRFVEAFPVLSIQK